MQVPAYWPVDVGVHCVEYKGVFVEVKKVMAMDDMDEESGEESMPDMEEEEAGEAEVVEAIEDMFNSSVGYRVWFRGSVCVRLSMEDIVC